MRLSGIAVFSDCPTASMTPTRPPTSTTCTVAGLVRSAGSEQLFNNVSPALNRELFNEAHEPVIKCWTQPGPFRFEGKHFHFRLVNPWAQDAKPVFAG